LWSVAWLLEKKASSEWWIADGPKRIQQIFDVFIDAPNGTNGYKPQWRVSLSGNGYNVHQNIKSISYSGFAGSFTQGLYGDVHAYCVLKGTDGNYKKTPDNVVEITGNGFLSQLISAALNAAFFRDSGLFGVSQLYPYSLYDVVSLVNSALRQNFTSPSQVSAAIMYLNNTFSSTITDGYECGLIEAPSSKSMFVPDPIT
jgi:hypothetical protein